MTVVRAEVRRLKVRGVVGSVGGVRDDVERGQRRADANANFGRICGTNVSAKYERVTLDHYRFRKMIWSCMRTTLLGAAKRTRPAAADAVTAEFDWVIVLCTLPGCSA